MLCSNQLPMFQNQNQKRNGMNDGKKGKNERTKERKNEKKEINERTKERKNGKKGNKRKKGKKGNKRTKGKKGKNKRTKGKNERTRFKNKNVKRGWRLMRCDVLKNKRENAAQTVKTRYPIIRSIELVISN